MPESDRRERPVVKLVLVLFGCYALVCVAVFLFQAKLVYYPSPLPSLRPSEVGLAFEDVTLTAKDGTSLHGWWFANSSARGAVIVCHGNAGSIAGRLSLARAFSEFGFEVLLFDYRGYGNSEGRPSEKGTYQDARAAWAHVTETRGWSAHRVLIYGESLGGAVAVELASQQSAGALALEATFTSLMAMGQRTYPWLPVRWLCRIRYDSLSRMADLASPVIVLHSEEDELVPYAMGQRLYEATAARKWFIPTDGGHNDGGFVGLPDASRRFRSLLEELFPRE